MKKAEKEFNLRLQERIISTQELSENYRNTVLPTLPPNFSGLHWYDVIGPLFTRIGVNTGLMVVGNMGTEQKMDYTIMGNAVNLASRLEGVNRQYNTRGILISEYTREQIGDAFALRILDQVRVVGINTPLRLYELLDTREDGQEDELLKIWSEGVTFYENRDFAGGLKIFKSIFRVDPEDKTAKLYLDRCESYLAGAAVPYEFPINNLTEK
jgi:adenylate cyclase